MIDFIKTLFSAQEETDLTEIMNRKPFLVDVRSPLEFNQKHIKGSVNIPLNTLSVNLGKLKGKKDVVVFCRSGNRSSQALTIIQSNGITGVVNGGSLQNVDRYKNAK